MTVGQVAVVTGPPGAGKTTVASLLADTPTPSVHLHTDDFWTWIRPGAIPPHSPQAHQQNTVVMGVIVEAAFGFARGGYHVVVDGIIGPRFVDQFIQAARAYDVGLRYIVLRPTEEITLQRAADRTHQAITDPRIVEAMYDQFRDLGPFESHVIDSTGLSASVTAALVRRAISAPHTVLWPTRDASHRSAAMS